ncbi:MAG: VOC family protein [Phycisphaerae bacterium]|nr:VOC family protein [Phycisphaerae bacterium]
MVKGLAHVCFVVRDLDKAVEFYVDKLGLAMAFEFKHADGRRYGAYLRAGGRCFIELFQGEVTAGDGKASFQHICLEVDDIEKTVAELQARGVEVGPVTLGCDQSYQAWLADVDGNKIELHAYTPDSWQKPHLA